MTACIAVYAAVSKGSGCGTREGILAVGKRPDRLVTFIPMLNGRLAAQRATVTLEELFTIHGAQRGASELTNVFPVLISGGHF